MTIRKITGATTGVVVSASTTRSGIVKSTGRVLSGVQRLENLSSILIPKAISQRTQAVSRLTYDPEGQGLRGLRDFVYGPDRTSLFINKAAADQQLTVDQLLLLIMYGRTPFDSFSLSDFIKVVLNPAGETTRVFADFIITADIIDLLRLKYLTDQQAVQDRRSFFISKRFSDIATMVDLAGVFDGITYSYGLSRTDAQGIVDVSRNSVLYRRAPRDGFADSVTETDRTRYTAQKALPDAFTEPDRIALFNLLRKAEAIAATDADRLFINKAVADLQGTADRTRFTALKTLTDVATMVDSFSFGDNFTYDQFKTIADLLAPADANAKTVLKTAKQGNGTNYVRGNLFTSSNAFTYAGYNRFISSNAVLAPDGTTSASVFIESFDTTSQYHGAGIRLDATLFAGVRYTASVFAKSYSGDRNFIMGFGGNWVGAGNFAYGLYNPQTGVGSLFLSNGGSPTVSMTAVGNGWYRCTLSFTPSLSFPTSTATNIDIQLHNGSGNLFQGNGTSGVVLFGAQLEPGTYANSYVPSVGLTSSTALYYENTPASTDRIFIGHPWGFKTSDNSFESTPFLIGKSVRDSTIQSDADTLLMLKSAGTDLTTAGTIIRNVWPAPIDIFSFVSSALLNNCTIARDPDQPQSPVGGVPLKMTVLGNDAHIQSYNAPRWTLAPASSGQTWTVSVWARGSVATSAQLFLFGVTSSNTFVTAPAGTREVLQSSWSRISFTATLAGDARITGVQARLDAIDNATTGTVIWFDGMQVELNSTTSNLQRRDRHDQEQQERLFYNMNKSSTDIQALTDASRLRPALFKTDDQLLADFDFLFTGKRLPDTAAATDAERYLLLKPVTDSTATADQIFKFTGKRVTSPALGTIDNDILLMLKRISDSVGVAEDQTVLSDGFALTYSITRSDSFSAQHYFARAVNFVRGVRDGFADTVTPASRVSKQALLIKTDAVAPAEFVNLRPGLGRFETVTATDVFSRIVDFSRLFQIATVVGRSEGQRVSGSNQERTSFNVQLTAKASVDYVISGINQIGILFRDPTYDANRLLGLYNGVTVNENYAPGYTLVPLTARATSDGSEFVTETVTAADTDRIRAFDSIGFRASVFRRFTETQILTDELLTALYRLISVTDTVSVAPDRTFFTILNTQRDTAVITDPERYLMLKVAQAGTTYAVSGTTVTANDRDRLFIGTQIIGTPRLSGDVLENIRLFLNKSVTDLVIGTDAERYFMNKFIADPVTMIDSTTFGDNLTYLYLQQETDTQTIADNDTFLLLKDAKAGLTYAVSGTTVTASDRDRAFIGTQIAGTNRLSGDALERLSYILLKFTADNTVQTDATRFTVLRAGSNSLTDSITEPDNDFYFMAKSARAGATYTITGIRDSGTPNAVGTSVTVTAADTDRLIAFDDIQSIFTTNRFVQDSVLIGSDNGFRLIGNNLETVRFFVNKGIGDTAQALDLVGIGDGLNYYWIDQEFDTVVAGNSVAGIRRSGDALENISFVALKDARAGLTFAVSGTTVTAAGPDRLFVGQQYGTTRFSGDPLERLSYVLLRAGNNLTDATAQTDATRFTVLTRTTDSIALPEDDRYTMLKVAKQGNNTLLQPGNFLTWSENLNVSATSWTVRNGISAVSSTAAIAPNGTLTANRITLNGSSDPFIGQTFITNPQNRTITTSIWAWTDGPSIPFRLYLYENSLAQVFTGPTVNLTATPTRYTLTGLFTVSGTAFTVRFDPAENITPAAGSSILVWGAQAEDAGQPGNYVPTTTASVVLWNNTANSSDVVRAGAYAPSIRLSGDVLENISFLLQANSAPYRDTTPALDTDRYLLNKLIADPVTMIDSTTFGDNLTYLYLQQETDSFLAGNGVAGIRRSGDTLENLSFIGLKDAKSGLTYAVSGTTVTANDRDRLFVGQQYGNIRFSGDPLERLSFNILRAGSNSLTDSTIETDVTRFTVLTRTTDSIVLPEANRYFMDKSARAGVDYTITGIFNSGTPNASSTSITVTAADTDRIVAFDDFQTFFATIRGVFDTVTVADLSRLFINKNFADDTTALDLIGIGDGLNYTYLANETDSILAGNGVLGLRRSGDAAENLSWLMLQTAKQGNNRFRIDGNLLTWSEQFEQVSGWTTSNCFVTSNVTTAPNGTATAEKLAENGTATPTTHFILSQSQQTTGSSYCLSAYVKSAGQARYLQFVGFGINNASETPTFNPDTGTVQLPSTSSVLKQAYMYPVGNGWYRCVALVESALTNSALQLYLSTNSSINVINSYTGTTGNGVFIWGAQVTAGTNETNYVATTGSIITTSVRTPADTDSVVIGNGAARIRAAGDVLENTQYLMLKTADTGVGIVNVRDRDFLLSGKGIRDTQTIADPERYLMLKTAKQGRLTLRQDGNFALFSEQFDNPAGWTTSFLSSIIANGTTAPDGTLTGDRFQRSGSGIPGSAVVSAVGSAPTAGVTYTISFYLRSNGDNRCVALGGGNLDGSNENVGFNPDTGVVTAPSTSSLFQSAGMYNTGINGWWRCWATVVANNTTTYRLYLTLASNPTDINYTTNVTGSVWLWGFQMAAWPALTDYIQTTSAARTYAVTSTADDTDNVRIGDGKASLRASGAELENFKFLLNKGIADPVTMLDSTTFGDNLTYTYLAIETDSFLIGNGVAGIRRSGDALENLSWLMLRAPVVDNVTAGGVGIDSTRNFLSYSDDIFKIGYWDSGSTVVNRVYNTTSAPTGYSTMYQIAISVAGSTVAYDGDLYGVIVSQPGFTAANFSTSNSQITVSVCLQATSSTANTNQRSILAVGWRTEGESTYGYMNINPVTTAVTTTTFSNVWSAPTVSTPIVTALGNNWYRYTFTVTAPVLSSTLTVYPYLGWIMNGVSVYNMAGLQVNNTSSVPAYISTEVWTPDAVKEVVSLYPQLRPQFDNPWDPSFKGSTDINIVSNTGFIRNTSYVDLDYIADDYVGDSRVITY